MVRLRPDEIGGARVLRTFTCAGQTLRRGGPDLTREQVLAMPGANRQALIDKNFMDVYPRQFPEAQPAVIGEAVERHVVSLGFGRFDVVEGRKINAEALTKEQAHALAGIEVKASKPRTTRKRS